MSLPKDVTMRPREPRYLYAATLALAGLLIACRAAVPTPPAASVAGSTSPAGSAAPSAAPSDALQRVRLVATAGLLTNAAFYIADEEGYFTEQGIALDWDNQSSTSDVVAALSSGQIDVGGTAPNAALGNAIARGIDVRIVADKGTALRGLPLDAVVVRKELWDAGVIRGPGDFIGHRFGMQGGAIGQSLEVATDRLMRTVGLRASQLDITNVSFADQPAALASGAIDVAWAAEPFLTRMIDERIAAILVRDDEIYENRLGAVVLYSGSFARQRSEVATRFLIAYLRGVRLYNDAFVKKIPAVREEVVGILTRTTNIKDPALYDRLWLFGLHPDGLVSVETLREDELYYLEQGKQQAPVDWTQVVDDRFRQEALVQLGLYR